MADRGLLIKDIVIDLDGCTTTPFLLLEHMYNHVQITCVQSNI